MAKASQSTTILLPAHNESQAIRVVIEDIKKSVDCNILVSASGCTDDTVAIAKRCGAEVVISPRGKANAISHALKYIQSDSVVMMDSDATYPARYIPIMVAMLQFNDAVLGVRDLKRTNMPNLNGWGNNFITRQAQLLYRYPIHDLCTGMWAFKKDAIRNMKIKSQGFTLEAEIFVYLIRNNLKIGQVTIDYLPRIGDRKINRLDHLKIMGYLWRHWLLD